MPIYEYQCTSCERRYDQLQPSTASKTDKCIDCGGLAERVLSAPARPHTSSLNSSSSEKPPYAICPIHDIILPAAINAIKFIKKRREASQNN